MINDSPSVGVIDELSFTLVRPQLCEFKHLPLQEIRVLELSHCELTNTDLLHLSELITNIPSLEELDLSSNQFTPQDDAWSPEGFAAALPQQCDYTKCREYWVL